MTLALDIQQLHKVYKSGTAALKGIDLQVQQGDFFALLGPNGAGKVPALALSVHWSIKAAVQSKFLIMT